jgi:predicted double-glycine peptidase
MVPVVRQATDYTCGPTSLRAVLAYFGRSFSEEKLAGLCRTNPRTGTEAPDIVRVSKKLGVGVLANYRATLEQLAAFVGRRWPAIVGWQAWGGDHYSVVVEVNRRSVWLMDPYADAGRVHFPIAAFVARWRWKRRKARQTIAVALMKEVPRWTPKNGSRSLRP